MDVQKFNLFLLKRGRKLEFWTLIITLFLSCLSPAIFGLFMVVDLYLNIYYLNIKLDMILKKYVQYDIEKYND